MKWLAFLQKASRPGNGKHVSMRHKSSLDILHNMISPLLSRYYVVQKMLDGPIFLKNTEF